MDRKLGIFGGATEGRLLAEACEQMEVPVVVSVTTEHGRGLLGESPFLTVHVGHMEEDKMRRWIEENGLTDVIDATHPFAREASANIRRACRAAGASYRRLARAGCDMAEREMGQTGREDGQDGREKGQSSREGGEGAGSLCWVDSVESAARVLAKELSAHPERKALLTTGSKELFHFAGIAGAEERLYARVLPLAEGIAACTRIGLKGSHILAMQGPFSYEMNLAMLRAAGASYLVTKESGRAGGFQEKLDAAFKLGCQVIVVKRPKEEGQGESLEELTAWVRRTYGGGICRKDREDAPSDGSESRMEESERAGCREAYEDSRQAEPDLRRGREIVLLGIGTGGLEQMTVGGIRALLDCDAILGASRMVESCRAMLKELREKGWAGERQRTEGTEAEGPRAEGSEAEGPRAEGSEAERPRAEGTEAEGPGTEGSGIGSGAVPVGKRLFCITNRPEEMLAWLKAHPEARHPVAVYSGDVGFYSGAKRLEELAARQADPLLCRRIPGISSMTYLAAKLGRSWEQAGILSLHGRKVPEDQELSGQKEWFLLLDGPAKLHQICRKLLKEGWPHARIWVGQRLSYRDEVISSGTPGELMDAEIDGLSVAWVLLEGERS